MNEQITPKTNTNERRFLPAAESSAKLRLDNFRTGIKDFQKKNPEVLGATVYGSMIKGDQAKETSDVDAFLYIDNETLPEDEKNKNEDVVESEYRNNFLKSLNIPEDEASKYYGDLRPKLLDSKTLDNDIKSRIEHDNQMKAYKKMLEEKYTYDASDEEKEKLLSQEPQFKNDFAISGMFHARVGSGIEKYRRLFLEKVKALPDEEMAEQIWKDVYFDLKTYEERSDPSKKIEIPSTLKDALRVYHPDLSKNINRQNDNDKIEELKSKISNSFS
ncbi:MAG: transf 2 protein [Patescibacteria group bacterium]|nr:transf 2 protein [Patescibacteria group bacterium]